MSDNPRSIDEDPAQALRAIQHIMKILAPPMLEDTPTATSITIWRADDQYRVGIGVDRLYPIAPAIGAGESLASATNEALRHYRAWQREIFGFWFPAPTPTPRQP